MRITLTIATGRTSRHKQRSAESPNIANECGDDASRDNADVNGLLVGDGANDCAARPFLHVSVHAGDARRANAYVHVLLRCDYVRVRAPR